MLNERSAHGVQKTPSIGINRMISGGVVSPGSKGRFSGLARKRVDRSDWTFSWGHVSKCPSISRKACCGNVPRGWDSGACRVRRIFYRHFSRWWTFFRGLKPPGNWKGGFKDENEPMLIIAKSLIEPIHAFEKNVRNRTYRFESTSDCHLAKNWRAEANNRGRARETCIRIVQNRL